MNAQPNRYRRVELKSCALAFALAALISPLAMSDNGKQGRPDKPCDARTIRGSYGIQMQGTRPTAPPPNGVTESVVGVVLRSYDGNGNFEQLDSINGSITGIVPNRPGLGTYEVSPDCTGTTSFQPDPNGPLVIQERFVIVDEGNEIRSITEAPAPLMITSVAKRVRKH